jgi:hypothetical protein
MRQDELNLDWELIHDLRQMVKNGASVSQLVDEIRSRLSTSRQMSIPSGSPFVPILYFVKAFHLGINEAKELGHWSRYLAGHCNDEQIDDVVMPLILSKQASWDA